MPNQLRDIIEAAPNAMIVVDSMGRIRQVNQLAERMFGYLEHDVLRQPVELLVPPQLRAAHVSNRTDYMRQPHTRPMAADHDLACMRSDGTEFRAMIALRPIVVDDITMIAVAIANVSAGERLTAIE
ncbi:MAG TPA: PAS domain S-box protein [Vicinamibacterales bacterium]|nr:PAS domain S-box protein [Vicinamibacterales bacterium]